MTREIDDFLTPALWNDGWSDRVAVKDQDEFLFAIWGPQVTWGDELYGSLCFRKKGSSRVVQEFVQLEDDMSVVEILRSYNRHTWDQYFARTFSPRKVAPQARCIQHAGTLGATWTMPTPSHSSLIHPLFGKHRRGARKLSGRGVPPIPLKQRPHIRRLSPTGMVATRVVAPQTSSCVCLAPTIISPAIKSHSFHS